MNLRRRIALPVIAAMMGIITAAFAFKPADTEVKPTERLAQWFEWQPANNSTDTADPNNYQAGDPGCSGGLDLCAVEAESIEDIADGSLQLEIQEALADPSSYEGSRVKFKE